MRKLARWIPTTLVMAALVLVVWATNAGKAIAQDTYEDAPRTVAEKTEKKDTRSRALKDFEERLTRRGMVEGPFHVIVSPTDKGANGIKYSNVPYVQFLGTTLIAFPIGKPDRWGNQEYIYSVNYTIIALRRINPAERRK